MRTLSVGHRLSRLGLSLWGLCLLASAVDAATLGIGLEHVTGLTNIPSPVALAHAGDSRLFVVLKGGKIRVFDGTHTTTFLDISGLVNTDGERGLLGLAFHPNYASNGFFFVYYSNTGGNEVIARYSVSPDPDVADADSSEILLTIPHPGQSNHNGGGLAFGPDGYLYAAVGDGGSSGDPPNNAQNLGVLLGKILRLHVDVAAGCPPTCYEIPATNPFLESPADNPATLPEIWAYGLRNPWRISFDRLTGDLFIGDVGQNAREEIDFQSATGPTGGRNYGWRCKEGFADFNNSPPCSGTLVPPILDYGHGEGCAVTGGYRYRGTQVPSLQTVYVFGDFCSGTIWGGIEESPGNWSRVVLAASGLRISSFGEDVDGELYVVDLGGGVYRIVPPRVIVTLAGSGTGSVSGPDGLDCPDACAVEYEPGSLVDLTANAASGSVFAGWSGPCEGLGACHLTMDGDKAVTATFSLRPFLEFSAAAYTVAEGGSATITVKRLISTVGTVMVDYAILPGSATAPPGPDPDYSIPQTGLTGTLTFTPGQSSRTFTISTINDTRAEGPETILLALSDPTDGAILGAQRTAILTIQDNDSAGSLQFGKGTYAVNESTGLPIKVKRAGGKASEVSVDVMVTGGTATPGTDYAIPGALVPNSLVRLTFGANQTSASFTIVPVNDGDVEPDETVELKLQNPTGGATIGNQNTARATIVDNDRIGTFQLTKAAYTVVESNGTVPLVVTRTGPTGAPASVNLVFSTADAAAGACGGAADYTPPSSPMVDFSTGQSRRTIDVPICVDATLEPTPETFTAELQNPSSGYALGAVTSAVVTIVDDRVRFSADSYTAGEGSGSVKLTLLRPAGTNQPLTVNYAATALSPGPGHATAAPTPSACAPGADFRPVNGAVTFGPGQTSKTVSIPLCSDGLVEGDETFTAAITGPSTAVGVPGSASVKVLDNDGPS